MKPGGFRLGNLVGMSREELCREGDETAKLRAFVGEPPFIGCGLVRGNRFEGYDVSVPSG